MTADPTDLPPAAITLLERGQERIGAVFADVVRSDLPGAHMIGIATVLVSGAVGAAAAILMAEMENNGQDGTPVEAMTTVLDIVRDDIVGGANSEIEAHGPGEPA